MTMTAILTPSSSAFSEAIQVENWLQKPGEWVEAPNTRRGGMSGVQRLPDGNRILYRKQQVGHFYRNWRHPLGEPTVKREQRAIQAMKQLGIRVPELIFCGSRQREGLCEAILVTAELHGFSSLDECHERGDFQRWDQQLQRRLFMQLGRLLKCLHRAHWQHGCLYPKHIFARVDDHSGEVELALLDLEKSRRRLLQRSAAQHDLAQLHRHAFWGDQAWDWVDEGYQLG